MLGNCGGPCLYTEDGSRLFGRHKTKEKALVQERAIKAGGNMVVTLDSIAESLELCGHPDLARRVDAAADDLLEQHDDMLEETGFEQDVMKRDPEVADEIYEDRIESIDRQHEYRRY